MGSSGKELPGLDSNQVFVEVSALNGGWVTLPEKMFVTNVDPELKKMVPSMCFLIQHPKMGSNRHERLVFDLGIKREMDKVSIFQMSEIIKLQSILQPSSIKVL